MLYYAELNMAQVGYTTSCTVNLAIVMMEEMFMDKATLFTGRADRLLEG